MKTILLLVLLTGISYSSYCQLVSIDFYKISLGEVFNELSDQTGYHILWANRQEGGSDKITVHLTNTSLTKALDFILRGTGLEYYLEDRTIVIRKQPKPNPSNPLFPPIYGLITDSLGYPLAGASVSLKDGSHTRHAITDAAGHFTFPATATYGELHISHLSYSPKIVQATGGQQNIILTAHTASLNEVEIVSTGYQQLSREQTTGSFTVITTQQFNASVSTNVLDRLANISNGAVHMQDRLNTIASGQLIIRGLSTFSLGIQKPLIILDHFEYHGDPNNLSPADVHDVTLLKDAAAGAVWGAKAANGVIVINTRKGVFNQPATFEAQANVSIFAKPDLFKLPAIAPADLVDLETALFKHGYRFKDTVSSNHLPFSPVYEVLFSQRRGQISPAAAASQLKAISQHDVRQDFTTYSYRPGFNQQYALTGQGGTASIAWAFTGAYDQNRDELHAGYKRLHGRLSHQYQAGKKLTVETDFYYTHSQATTGRPAYGSITTVTGDIPIYSLLASASGSALPLATYYRSGYLDTVGGGKLLDWRYYPLDDYRQQHDVTKLQDVNASIGFAYQAVPDLRFIVRYRIESQHTENNHLYGAQSYLVRDLVNTYAQLDRAVDTVFFPVPPGAILDTYDQQLTAHNLRTQAQYDRYWRNHSLSALFGAEGSELRNHQQNARAYGYDPDLLTVAQPDFAHSYPLFTGGSSKIPNIAGYEQTNIRFLSIYGNAAYQYAHRYTLSGSIRRDASNIFGVHTNKKGKPLWSLGVAWELSQWEVTKKAGLRLRLTHGHQGNIDPQNVALTTIRYAVNNALTNTPIARIQHFANPDLSWEDVAMTNLGLDVHSQNKRINASIEYYRKTMTDLYGVSPIDATLGLGQNTVLRNVGGMKGSGVDIQLTTLNLMKPITWATTFIINSYQDRVTRLNIPTTSGSIPAGGGILNTVGYPQFGYFAYRWAGLDPQTGDPQGYLNGAVSKNYGAILSKNTVNDLVYIGPLQARYFGSLHNQVTWRHLTFTVLLSYKFGYYFRRPSIRYNDLAGQLRGHADYGKRWQKPGDERHTQIPSMVYPFYTARDDFYSYSTVLAEKGDHIRVEYLMLHYALKQFKFFIELNQPGLLWTANKAGLDPDYATLAPVQSLSIGSIFHL
ncbi:TonB-linked outer membrane protein, SusC/RagA family [bacterium A37T11]|nr:TonB-linked outer membrane protein, SusC/RagA family [bacterium A37T11]